MIAREIAKVFEEIAPLDSGIPGDELGFIWGDPQIQEQIKVIKKAAKLNVEAVVVECMAVDRHLQFLCETKMIK